MNAVDVRARVAKLRASRNWIEICRFFESNAALTADTDYYLTFCQALIQVGRFKEALKLLKNANFPSSEARVQRLKLLYDCEYRRCNFPAAEVLAAELKALDRSGDATLRLARAQLKQNDFKGALDSISSIHESHAAWLVAEELRSDIQARLRDRTEDEENWKKYAPITTPCLDFFSIATPSTSGCTVVIPCYNCAKFVRDTIQSVLFAGHADLEVLAIDDCSTDDTLRVLEECASANPKVRILRHLKNSGLAATRNTGIVNARKDFITFLDSDDLMIQGGISRRVQAIQRKRVDNPRVVGSYGGSVTIGEDVRKAPKTRKVQNQSIISFLSGGGDCPFNANQPLFLASLLRGSGGFPEEQRTAEDWPFWMALLRRGGIIVPTHMADVTYRSRVGSMVRETALLHLDHSHAVLETCNQESDALFQKPISHYQLQRLLLDRFFRFWGMAIAGATRGGKLGKRELMATCDAFLRDLDAKLPDLCLLNSSYGFFRSRLLQGAERFLCTKDVERGTDSQVLVKTLRGFALGAHLRAEAELHGRFKGNAVASSKQFDVAFLPHKTYHAKSAELIMHELRKSGLRACIIDFSAHYGDEGVSEYLRGTSLESFSLNRFLLSGCWSRVAVVFNDWDKTVKRIIDYFRSSGASIVSIVEGVNDYLSIDTGVWRPAYRNNDHLLLPGEFHRKYFADHPSVHVSGVQRLDPLVRSYGSVLASPERTIKCVINCNFTYGVLVAHRLSWLRDACDALVALGIEPVISRHPQDVGSLGELQRYVSGESIYDLLQHCRILITRFSGLVYEALLSGAQVVYYNPGIEDWDMFFQPMGAYSYVESPERLERTVEALLTQDFDIGQAKDFLRVHCNVDLDQSSSSSSEVSAHLIRGFINAPQTQVARAPEGSLLAPAPSVSHLLERMHRALVAESEENAAELLQEVDALIPFTSGVALDVLVRRRRHLSIITQARDGSPASPEGRVVRNLFLVFSCSRYAERHGFLRPLYRSNLAASDAFLIVTGGHGSNGVKHDVLELSCSDSYEGLPEKVVAAIRHCVVHLKFERLVKVDDDIFVNFDAFYQHELAYQGRDYYGRMNPPHFGSPLNERWHVGKVSAGHKYFDRDFPIAGPAQWCSGGCYVLSRRAAEVVASFKDLDHVRNHVYEDYMIFEILLDAGICPSFHEICSRGRDAWMHPTLDGVMDQSNSRICSDFDLSRFVSIHCGSTNKYSVDDEKLRFIFASIARSTSAKARC